MSFAFMSKSPRQVPPPQGSNPAAKPSYGRIIPKEEIGDDVQAWRPELFGGVKANKPPISAPAPAAAPVPPPPPPPDPRALLAAARQAGYQDGLRDGKASADAFKQHHARQVATQLGALLQSFDAAFQDLEGRMAEALTQASVALARQVVREELRQHPEHIARIAHEAVEALMLSARHVRVRVHPDDLPLVEAGAADTLRARGATLIADPNVQRGGCSVESDLAQVDALIEQRWALAASQLGQKSDWNVPPADGGLVEEN